MNVLRPGAKQQLCSSFLQTVGPQVPRGPGLKPPPATPRCPRAGRACQALTAEAEEETRLPDPLRTPLPRGRTDGQRSTSNRNNLYPGPAQFFHIVSDVLFSSFPSFLAGIRSRSSKMPPAKLSWQQRRAQLVLTKIPRQCCRLKVTNI